MNPDSENPRISVLMSVFNGGAFLRPALDSVLGQTFTDFELIIIDDGSTDGSWEVLAEYAEKDSRIVLRRNASNIGLTRSLNLGLSLARGEYIARFDADDISLPERFARQVAFFEAHPEVDILSTATRLIGEDGRTIGEPMPPLSDEAIKAELLIKNFFCHPAMMARLQTIKAVGGYDESFSFAQDYDLWRRLIPLARFACLSEVLYLWRNRKDNISNSKRIKQLECAFISSLRILQRVTTENNPLDVEAYRRTWFAYHGYLKMLHAGDIKRLEPLWDLLHDRAALINRSSQGFVELGLNLLRIGKFREAFNLIDVIEKRLLKKIPLGRILQSLVRYGLNKLFSPFNSIRQ